MARVSSSAVWAVNSHGMGGGGGGGTGSTGGVLGGGGVDVVMTTGGGGVGEGRSGNGLMQFGMNAGEPGGERDVG